MRMRPEGKTQAELAKLAGIKQSHIGECLDRIDSGDVFRPTVKRMLIALGKEDLMNEFLDSLEINYV